MYWITWLWYVDIKNEFTFNLKVTGTCWWSVLFLSGLGDLGIVLCDRLFMDSCRFRRKSFLASLTAACSWSSERTERRKELLQLTLVSWCFRWAISFSITIGPGGPTRVARFRALDGKARLNKSCEKGQRVEEILLLSSNPFQSDGMRFTWLFRVISNCIHSSTLLCRNLLLRIVCPPCSPPPPLLSRFPIWMVEYFRMVLLYGDGFVYQV